MADWRARDGLDALLDALGADDGETRFVGGVVRDTLMGMPVADIDLATRLAPDTVMDRVQAARFKAVPTGLAHGTVTAVLPGGPVEVTTLRRDVSTDGRHATVAFTDDWREDAARRDFTINALSAGPDFGRDGASPVFDYFGGVADLDARTVRFIGDPLQRIAEDHLRILRFFRFHARFGHGAPEAAGLAACVARANDLMALSRERIADEMLKLLAVADPVATIGVMAVNGIWRPVLPEIAGAAPLARLVAREHRAGVSGDPVRRLAALLPADPAVMTDVAARLRLSKVQRERMAAAAVPREPAPAEAVAYRRGLAGAIDAILLGEGEPKEVARLAGWSRPVLPLKGGDLIARGLTAGPQVAAALQAVERRWLEEGFPDAARVAALAEEEAAARR